MTHATVRFRFAAALASAASLALAACAGPREVSAPPAGDCTQIALSSNDWHAGLYLPASAFDPSGPVRTAFPDADFVAVGWGDARAYPGPLTVSRAVSAIAWPSKSVVHVSVHEREPSTAFRQDHVDVAVSTETLDRLAGLIAAEITGPPVSAGLTRRSAFFPGASRYHAFKTCNVWLAQTLEAAGIETGWTPGHVRPGSLLRAIARTQPQTCPAEPAG
ncbi:MAG: DUF2459 domain-containing protein [Oceanicaulis sp.]